MAEGKMDENEWRYHGEGNKSLVVAHAQRCVVLRFLKFPPNRKKASDEILQHLQNIVDFSKNVVKEFLGESSVHCGEVVQLPLDFVKQLCLKIQSERPESRCDKDLDTLSGYALCLPNLTRLQTYRFVEHRPILCVEIKPKCGFIPFSSDVTHELKHKVCRYCMHQQLKVATGKWKQIKAEAQGRPIGRVQAGVHGGGRAGHPTGCCLEGNKQRMHFALKSLLQDAQNNLKIFKNGELIYGCRDARDTAADWAELARHLRPFFFPAPGLAAGPQRARAVLRELVRVLARVLLSADGARPGALCKGPAPRGPRVCQASPFAREPRRAGKSTPEDSGLPKGCLLYRTLQVQMLDTLDIEGLYPLYKRVQRYLEEFPEARKSLQIDGPYNDAFYQKLLDRSTEDDGTLSYALTKVQQYRVAMTAKDCSIMIALSPCLQDGSSDERPVVPSSKSRFAFSVSVLDLDLKPYESIPHQYKLDAKIVNYYSKTVHTKEDAAMSARFKENEDCTLVLHKV
ncbi:inositol-pentakisphosphate 2-kinase isoform X2 [Choloepus didactylus]|uniref:inositol-pentakisphosphate 2-kinase isoform X2 n=1 Tax=Choloepus didactylus TaxID=27675 RepID=UPI0018A01C6A|nr:inositol-pentakisphosphate 2-kinase isoform X2 [Choloepus didactylus]